METIKTIFKFIDTIDITIEEFEKNCGFDLGTLQTAMKMQISLPKEITSKIAKQYGKNMRELGFYVIEGSPFQSKTDFIIEEDINKTFLK